MDEFTIEHLKEAIEHNFELMQSKLKAFNAKLKETSHQIIFRYRHNNVRAYLVQGSLWETEVNLDDDELVKLMSMNAEDIIKYLKS